MQVLSGSAHRAENLRQEPRRGLGEIITCQDAPHAFRVGDDHRAHAMRYHFFGGLGEAAVWRYSHGIAVR